MKRVLVLGLVVMTALMFVAAKDKEETAESTSPAATVGLRHVVMFKYKDGTSQEQMDKLLRAFLDLKTGIGAIVDIEGGQDCGIENLGQGYHHCVIVSLADEAGRKEYLDHPVHQEFVALVRPHLDAVHVIDYKPQR